MNGENLFRALSLLEDDLLEEAEEFRPAKRARGRRWIPLAAACCLLLVLGGTTWWFAARSGPSLPGGNPSSGTELPLLTIDREGFFGEAMGFEGYEAYTIDELVSANPWNAEGSPETLPVFRNPSEYDKDGRAAEPDLDAMREWALEIAGRLGMDTESLTVSDDYPDEETIRKVTEKFAAVGEEVPAEFFKAGRVFAENGEYKVEVDSQFTAAVHFKTPVSLPAEYSFTHHASLEETEKTAEYLQSQYAALLDMRKPTAAIEGGNYDIYRRQSYSISFYEGEGSVEEQILNYHCNQVSFYCDDDGKLFLARVYRYPLTDKVGDYPILTPEQAQARLKTGKYLTTVPAGFPGGEYVRKAELVYRLGREATWMPYYRFYVEVPELQWEGEGEDGMHTYGAFYVPAVEEEYIGNLTVWDGSFN